MHLIHKNNVQYVYILMIYRGFYQTLLKTCLLCRRIFCLPQVLGPKTDTSDIPRLSLERSFQRRKSQRKKCNFNLTTYFTTCIFHGDRDQAGCCDYFACCSRQQKRLRADTLWLNGAASISCEGVFMLLCWYILRAVFFCP